MDIFTSFVLGSLVALAYAVGEYTGRKRREHEIHAKVIENMLRELRQDHIIEMIGNDIFAGTKKRGDKNAKHKTSLGLENTRNFSEGSFTFGSRE